MILERYETKNEHVMVIQTPVRVVKHTMRLTSRFDLRVTSRFLVLANELQDEACDSAVRNKELSEVVMTAGSKIPDERPTSAKK